MSGNVAVSKLRLIMLVRESAISLTQSFKSLTGTLSRPVALAVDIELICSLTKQLVIGGILKSSPDGFILLTKDLGLAYTFGFKSLTPFDKVRFPGFA